MPLSDGYEISGTVALTADPTNFDGNGRPIVEMTGGADMEARYAISDKFPRRSARQKVIFQLSSGAGFTFRPSFQQLNSNDAAGTDVFAGSDGNGNTGFALGPSVYVQFNDVTAVEWLDVGDITQYEGIWLRFVHDFDLGAPDRPDAPDGGGVFTCRFEEWDSTNSEWLEITTLSYTEGDYGLPSQVYDYTGDGHWFRSHNSSTTVLVDRMDSVRRVDADLPTITNVLESSGGIS